jgi:hypothetical protein
MSENKELLIKEASEPYRPTIEAIHQLLPLASVKENEGWDIVHRFNMLCEHYAVNQAKELLHLMFRRKAK